MKNIQQNVYKTATFIKEPKQIVFTHGSLLTLKFHDKKMNITPKLKFLAFMWAIHQNGS